MKTTAKTPARPKARLDYIDPNKPCRGRDRHASWRYSASESSCYVCVLVTEADLLGWVAVDASSAGFLATPRIGNSRYFFFLDDAQRYVAEEAEALRLTAK